ncbi:MAG: hypothetical protein AB7R69_02510 [Candidatus Babeliales bacterium]
MKKILLIMSLGVVSTSMHIQALTRDQVQQTHGQELQAEALALGTITNALLNYLGTKETEAWIKNLSQRNFQYPTALLTTQEVDTLVKAVQDIQKGTAVARGALDPRYKAALQKKIPAALVDVVSTILEQAITINQTGFKRGEVTWFKAQWKPLTQSFFTRLEALIKSFGQQGKKVAFTLPERQSPHYFICL